MGVLDDVLLLGQSRTSGTDVGTGAVGPHDDVGRLVGPLRDQGLHVRHRTPAGLARRGRLGQQEPARLPVGTAEQGVPVPPAEREGSLDRGLERLRESVPHLLRATEVVQLPVDVLPAHLQGGGGTLGVAGRVQDDARHRSGQLEGTAERVELHRFAPQVEWPSPRALPARRPVSRRGLGSSHLSGRPISAASPETPANSQAT
jgi:hypothetical protein